MAEIVIAVAAKVAEVLVKPTIRQGQYLFCVNKVIKNLDNEKEELKVERDSIQDRKEQAEKRTEKIVDAVDKWLNDVRNLLDEVEQLEQDVKESHCFQGWCPTWRRYRLCKEMEKKTKTIIDLKAKSNFETFSRLASLPGIKYFSSQKFTYFESTKAAYEQLLEALKDDNVYMIGLSGMGGSGKTTLATEVGKKALELNLFDQVIPPITVSQTPNIRSMQGKMVDMLNMEVKEETEEGRAQRLWLRLREEKRVLIIVDDVWAKFDLELIGIRLDDNEKPNFKVLLTTRQRQVCDFMDCQRQIFLNLLSESDAWTLFRKHAGIGDESSSNLLKVAQEVSNECKGLPIAIKAVGSSLKGAGDDEWIVALDRLRNPERFNDNGEEGFTDAFTCLKLSYDYLRKEEKMLFLLCSMFPEDHEISIEDLFRYGVGLGLYGDVSSFDLARRHIRVGIKKLVDSCLLFHYDEKHCEKEYFEKEGHVKMHDMVRDVALCIASRSEDRKILVNFSKDLNALAENGAVKDYFAISSWYTKTDLSSHQLDAPKLEILLLEIQNENSQDFSFALSDGVKELKVMSILNSNYSPSLLLFQSTPYLTNLRTLCLRGWKLGDLSFIISLTRLEALDLRNCHFTELPKGMEKLNKLKLLDLSGCEFPENFNHEVLVSFSQLEELYVTIPWPIVPSEVINDIVTIPNLQRFWITGFSHNNDYGENTRVLRLHYFNISDFRASKQNLLQRAEHVSLEGLRGGCKNVIPDMVRVMGGMEELTDLCFYRCSEIECLIDTTYLHVGSFQVDTLLPKLVKLKLSEMDNLKEVCRGPPLLVLGFFEKLEQLFIRKCQQLHSIFPETCNLCNLKILKIGNYDYSSYDDGTAVVSLFSLSVAQSLQQLEELSIQGCKELKHIIKREGEGGTNTGDNSQLMFPNLKKLCVRFCPKLEFIFPLSFALQGLLQLEEVKISDASELKYVFFQHDHEAFSSHHNHIQIMLTQLKVFELHNLENLLGICPENYHLGYPSLMKLSCGSLPKLTTSYINTTVSWTQRQQHLNRGVALDEDRKNLLTSNLQQLELHELPQLKFIWSSSTPRQVLSFQFLQHLNLDSCANLKSVFSMATERSLPELTSLSIYRCEELEEIMVETGEPQSLNNTEVCFPKLSELVIKKCNKLKSLFSIAMVGMPPQLSTLNISEAARLEVVFRHSNEYDTDNREQIMLPSLRRLQLENLPSFVNIFEGFNFQAPKLQELSTHECPKFGPILRGTQVISRLHTEVDQLEQDVKANQCFEEYWCPTCGRSGIECSSSQNFMYFESTKAAYDELLEALKDDSAHMIGLYGRGGSGKTTLATEVGEKAKSELKLFDQVISVTVSQTPNIRSIQGKIANMLNSKLQQEYEEGRVRRLWLRPREAKRVLIILDDVWAKLDLKEIGIRLDDNKNLNLKVLLTTRRREVCELMDCQTQIFLKRLSDGDAWSLFHKHTNIGSGSSSNLLEVAREVSDKCKGLPIAIKAVGSSLKGKGDHEWKVALERLRNPEQFDDNGEEDFADAFTCLKLSYDYLRNKEAEVLFLICSMFPEDHEINIEDLIRYGVGLGLSGDFISFDLARSFIKAGINKLVHSCLLFYNEKEDHVKMHDVARDVALCIASRVEDRKILVNLANDLNAFAISQDLNAFAISSWYEETSLISYQLDAPRLEILLLQTRNENSLDFSFASSDGVKELKVMSILNSYYSRSLLLLQSTQWLINLRTLRLSGWNLGDLSFLISLTRLEALDLRNCGFTKLPKGMEKLNKLKLLHLSECEISENFNYEAIGSCLQLEELYAFGYNQKCPSQRMEDIVALPNLRRFVIKLGWFRTIYYEECTRVLHLREFNISNLGVSKQNLLQRAEDVSLVELHGGCKNIIPDMVRLVGDMKELNNLGFHYCSEIECLIDTTHHHAEPFQVDASLPRLVKLELREMDNLKEVCRGPPSLVLGFFKKLEQLFIKHCRQLHNIFPEACNLCNLKILKIGNYDYIGYNWNFFNCTAVVSLFSVSVAQSLQQLEELSIEGCKNLKHIITSEGEGGTNTGDNSQLRFPNLKKLRVSSCPKLEFIFPLSFDPQGLLQLQELQISYSSGLKYVFGQYDHEPHSSHGQIMLPSLNVFQLYNLENLLGICPENYYLRYSSSVKLRCLDCPKLNTSCINVTVGSK